MRSPRITPKDVEQLRELLEYNPATGLFTWLAKRNCHGGPIKVGDVAGTAKDGYVVIGVAGKQYRAHRLAWVWMTGKEIPKGYEPDHENRNRSDNRWDNLRLATRGQNVMNSEKVRPDNNSGVRGVSWVAGRTNKWLARISVAGKIIDLGYFHNLDDAAKARREAENKYYGSFACLDRKQQKTKRGK